MNIIYDFLRSDGSVVVNKKLIHAIGLHEAIIFSELISKYNYFKVKGMIQNGYFYNTSENLFQDTGLSPKQQRKAISNLEELGLVKTSIRGVPAKKYFKIIDDINVLSSIIKQYQQLGKKVTTRISNSAELVEQKGHGNNTNKIILNNNTNIYITLASDGCCFLSFYLSCFYDKYNKEHMKVKETDIDFIELNLLEIKETFDYEEYTEMVLKYFEQLPNSNNGNILSFITAKDRYLLNGDW